MSTAAIQTRGLSKVYRPAFRAPVEAVQSLDLAVPRGSTFGLLGPNGAGKTTTILMVLGVLRPTSGTYELLGHPMGAVSARAKVGYLPERFQLPGFLRAREFLGYQGRLYGLGGTELRERIERLLKLVGLYERADSPISAFSKGMQQRLALAQALLNDPDLVILDEPTSALDPLGRRDVRAIVEGLKEEGKTVLLNSHILSDVERVCDQVAILRNGRLERQGSIATLLEGALHVTLRVAGLDPALVETLRGFGSNVSIASEAGVSEVTLDVPDEARLPEIAEAVGAAGARLYALIPRKESLEDLFVRVVEGEA